MVYVVAYDLVEPHDTSDNCAAVGKTLKGFGTWARIEQSVWLIESTLSAADVRDEVFESMHKGDRLLVARLGGSWATRSIAADVTDWLKARTF
jgi:hypothetical protein